MTADLPPCTFCGGPRARRCGGHGWCITCYHRWYRAGAHEGEPPHHTAATLRAALEAR